MDKNLTRVFIIELIGTFALVYLSAGAVCVNQVTTVHPVPEKKGSDSKSATAPPKEGVNAGLTPLTGHQPGVVGIALAAGLTLGVALAATVPLSGGYLNPAITLMLWVFNRIDTKRMSRLIIAQLLGAVLAGACVRWTFAEEVLRLAHFGTPHLNELTFDRIGTGSFLIFDRRILSGTAIELVLTFLLVFAIFGIVLDATRSPLASVGAGVLLTAGILMAFPLTGGALNPARWFGTVVWEFTVNRPSGSPTPLVDMFVYIAGPILGALLAGVVYFKLIAPAYQELKPAETLKTAAELTKPTGSPHIRAKK
jgi:glycerol uptake facilitator-like aquaporin